MNAATRARLVKEGRTHWFSVRVAVEGRRFNHYVHLWGRDEQDVRDHIVLRANQSIVSITEEHR